MTHVENPSKSVEGQTEVLQENVREELSEDMEVMGPGQILSDARKVMGLTQQDVADKLNFRKTLVNDIENEMFDNSLPETFNRGYLRNYAKLVNVSQEDVLLSYEQLNVAKAQASELQSFSKGTEKLAESNRIMWISYLILAILIGSTVIWWMQNNAEQASTEQAQISRKLDKVDNTQAVNELEQSSDPLIIVPESSTTPEELVENITQTVVEEAVADKEISSTVAPMQTSLDEDTAETQENAISTSGAETTKLDETSESEVALTNVVFTFSGDCWVNISDATGERIAWGVKKLGYVMKISGQAPFNVTLGKPELVTINFADDNIDMTQFNAGNIAKFTLPIAN